MSLLILAAAVWLGLHLGLAGTRLRGVLARPLGENGFRGLFSAASVAALALLIYAFRHAPPQPLWLAPPWLRGLLAAAMLPALYLLLASFTTVSLDPADAGTRRGHAQGILRVTRHPMLWSFAIWAAVHIAGRGELAATLFFGTFLLTAACGMPSLDAKAARRKPAAWQAFAAETSILPGGAILAGRNHLAWCELGWLVPLGALALWLALIFLHRPLFGVAPLPGV